MGAKSSPGGVDQSRQGVTAHGSIMLNTADLKRRFPYIVAALAFAFAFYSGADVAYYKLSMMDTEQFEFSNQAACSKKFNGIHCKDDSAYQVSYSGIEGHDQRPIDIEITVRFRSMERLDMYFTGKPGEKSHIGSFGPSDIWQHTQTVRMYKPVILRVQLQPDTVVLHIGQDARDSAQAPGFKIKGLQILGLNTGLDIFDAAIYSVAEDESRTLIKSSVKRLASSNVFGFVLAIIGAALGALLVRIDTALGMKFSPAAKTGGGGFVLLTWLGAYLAFSWIPPSLLTTIAFTTALIALKAGNLFTSGMETSGEFPAKAKGPAFMTGFLAMVFAGYAFFYSMGFGIITATVLFIVLVGSSIVFSRSLSKALHLDRGTGLLADAFLALPLSIWGLACLFEIHQPRAASQYFCIGCVFWFVARFLLLNRNRKRAPYSQGILLLTFIMIVACAEGALSFASGSGAPLPKIGGLLNVKASWMPETLFDMKFAIQDGQPGQYYQGQHMAIPKPEGEYRIVFLGGSTTFGSEVDPAFNFVTQVRHKLEADFPDRDIKVYNCAYLGFGSFQMLLLYQKLLAGADVDLVVMYTLNNDMYQPGIYTYREIFAQLEKGRPNALVRTRSFLTGSSLYRLMVAVNHTLLKEKDFVPAWKITRDFEINIGAIIDQAAERNATVILIPELVNMEMADDDQHRLVSDLGMVLREQAKMHGAVFVDSGRVKLPADKDDVFTDNVHLNADGNRLVYGMIYPAVKKQVLKESGE